MRSPIVPESFLDLLTAFASCFHAPSYRNFVTVVTGWVHCLGRRTVTAVVLAAGAVGTRHISVFHRFFARAQWVLDEVGEVVFRLALAGISPDQPLYVSGDDTLCRKSGTAMCLATMHHDPCSRPRASPSAASGMRGSCSRSGCRCPWAPAAALPSPSCSASTGVPNAAASSRHHRAPRRARDCA